MGELGQDRKDETTWKERGIRLSKWVKTNGKGNMEDFGAVVKNLPANAGDTSSIPGPGRSLMPRSN